MYSSDGYDLPPTYYKVTISMNFLWHEIKPNSMKRI